MHWRPTFGLRALFFVCMLVALYCGAIYHAGKREQATLGRAEALRQLWVDVNVARDSHPLLPGLDGYFTRIESVNATFVAPDRLDDIMALIAESPRITTLRTWSMPTIGDRHITALKHHRALELCFLDCTAITDESMRVLLQLPRLDTLFVHGCTGVNGGGFDIRPTPQNLKVLSAGNTGINNQSLKALARYPQLEDLRIPANPVDATGIESIAQMRRLKRLIMDGLSLSGVQYSLKPCVHLEGLSLANTDITTKDIEMLEVHHLASLKTLFLNNTQIDDRAIPLLAQCNRLEVLRIDGTAITRQSLAALSSLPYLREVDYGGETLGIHQLANSQ